MTDDVSSLPGRGISAVILAGGQSRRLGMDKSLLKLEGQSLLARTVGKLTALSDDIIIVTSSPENYKHLLVRISGYNAYFVTLNREIQMELIERAEYGL